MLHLPRALIALPAACVLALCGTVQAGPLDPVTPEQHVARKAAANANTVGVITGDAAGTYLRITEDLASVIDDDEQLRVLPIAGKGSLQNLTDLLYLRGVDAAIVQADVLGFVRDKGLHYDADKRIEYVTKLFNEHVHVLAREGISTFSDLEGRKVNLGTPASGGQMTGQAVFSALNVKAEFTSLSDEQALAALKAGKIDAMLVVAARPSPLLLQLGAQDKLHAVSIPFVDALGQDYTPARLDVADYPGLVTKPVDTVAVSAVLAVFAWPRGSDREQRLTRFINRFFDQFETLLEPAHHPKWQEVNLAAELPAWKRNAAAQSWLESNAGSAGEASGEPGEFMQKFIDWQKSAGQP